VETGSGYACLDDNSNQAHRRTQPAIGRTVARKNSRTIS
jgi:hypothetical protein